ncbi:galactose-3-O-sulfotransferase 2-like [Mizuhopecten yessoensis]|uniref:Galactose-3-O-sulfotransferase 3 n=1 Tax=Mizuhopecten yessoensis TaxID=6573 RepID=A0A210Q1V5_MIZYE|nr:galactose-3-O-sulfotransferase 2-like [Mizuhopecten yessoensis]OWF42716.1 Galactose-3-O-sulfotransferase 3 [Mizuhopecten yessoensis]
MAGSKPIRAWTANQGLLIYHQGHSSHDTNRKQSSNQDQYIQKGDPVNHIAFVKIHKAASTTIANIFQRYGYENNLVFAQPRGKGGDGPSLTPRYFFPPPNNKIYDIACAHAGYNREEFSTVLPNDTVYIGVVREPYSHFRSFIRYFRPKNVLNIPGNHPVLDYLSHSEHHIKYHGSIHIRTKKIDHEFNMMAIEFGFPGELFLNMDRKGLQMYLRKLDKEMDIMLVVEHFDESIVLMRRLLNWDLRYMLYGKIHVNKEEDPRLQFGSTEEQLFKNRSYLDYALYDLFLEKMKKNLKRQLPDFYEELAYFRKTRIKFENFCLSAQSGDKNITELSFEGSKWNKSFVIKKSLCENLFISASTFFRKILREQRLRDGIM